MRNTTMRRLSGILVVLVFLSVSLSGQGAIHPFSGERHQAQDQEEIRDSVDTNYSWLDLVSQAFGRLQQELQELLVASARQLEEGSILALAALLGFSLLYGMAHALGPGHGKTLAASWFLARPGKLTQALELGAYTGLVHGLVVLVLLAVAWLTESSLRSIHLNAGSILQSIGATGVVILGGLLAVMSIISLIRGRDISLHLHFHPEIAGEKHAHDHKDTHNHYLGHTEGAEPDSGKSACSCSHGHDRHADKNAPDHPPVLPSGSGGTPGSRGELLALALASSIIPCPASIMIMAFSVSLGLFLPGILAMAAMSLGVGIISAIAGLAVLLAHRGGKRYLDFKLPGLLPPLRRVLRLLGGIFIVLTGWTLLSGIPA